MGQTYRTIRLEDEAALAVDKQKGEDSRFEETYSALEWLLARNPEQGILFEDGGGDNVRVCFHASAWAETQGILAVFAYTENEVIVYGIAAVRKDSA